MWQLLLGFGLGIYVGTYFNCKPTLDNIIENIRKKYTRAKKIININYYLKIFS